MTLPGTTGGFPSEIRRIEPGRSADESRLLPSCRADVNPTALLMPIRDDRRPAESAEPASISRITTGSASSSSAVGGRVGGVMPQPHSNSSRPVAVLAGVPVSLRRLPFHLSQSTSSIGGGTTPLKVGPLDGLDSPCRRGAWLGTRRGELHASCRRTFPPPARRIGCRSSAPPRQTSSLPSLMPDHALADAGEDVDLVDREVDDVAVCATPGRCSPRPVSTVASTTLSPSFSRT